MFILTAAHCFDGGAEMYGIRLSSQNHLKINMSFDVKLHQNYSSDGDGFDIALIKISMSWLYYNLWTNLVRPIYYNIVHNHSNISNTFTHCIFRNKSVECYDNNYELIDDYYVANLTHDILDGDSGSVLLSTGQEIYGVISGTIDDQLVIACPVYDKDVQDMKAQLNNRSSDPTWLHFLQTGYNFITTLALSNIPYLFIQAIDYINYYFI